VPRDPAKDIPFLVNIYFKSDGELAQMGQWGMILSLTSELSSSSLDDNFRTIHAVLMTTPTEDLGTMETNEVRFMSALTSGPMVITDDAVRQVASGSRDLYVMASWRYRTPGSSKILIKDFCAFFEGNLTNWKSCPGIHNSTFAVQ